MDWVTLILVALLYPFVLAMFFCVKEQQENIEYLSKQEFNRGFKDAQTLAKLKAENTRLRRRCGEINDDEDVFPARQHNIVSFKKMGDGNDMAGGIEP